jgi:transcriptional regulator with XRE-family HTH domain
MLIRELRGVFLQRDLAERFGICRSTVSEIQSGKRWKYAR